jgi:hypothetical protein
MALVTIRTVHQTGSFNSFSQQYYLRNDDDTDLSQTTAETQALAQFNTDFGVVANNFTSDRVSNHSWRVTVIFNAKTPGNLDFPEASNGGTLRTRFNFQARSKFIKNSLKSKSETVTTPTGSTTLTNQSSFGGLINVEHDGVRGVHLNAPSPSFVKEYTLENTVINDAYLLKLFKLCEEGSVNSATFLGRPPGELMLSSVSGGKISDTSWQLSFGFAYAENQTNIILDPIFNFIVPSKWGHDYLWTYDQEITRKLAGVLDVVTFVPTTAMVEQVWPERDLNEIFLMPDPTDEK